MDELKDKIILAVKETIAKNVVFATGDYLYAEIDYDDVDHIAEQVADTLIAANIGDITEWKERAEKAEKERDEYRKSTHIALRGIEILKRNILRYFATEFPSILQQAEREIEEEKGE